MSVACESTPALPTRRADLTLGAADRPGHYVIKDPVHRTYFQMGEQEHFLFCQLDGTVTRDILQQRFAERFGEPLAAEDLQDFLATLQERGLLASAGPTAERTATPALPAGENLLYWRLRLFDPARLLAWLEPHLRWVWTRGFLALTLALILPCFLLAWAERYALVAHLPQAFGLEMVLLAWLVLMAATFCHEIAHGLTCTHFGGEVHDIGFLLLYFTPCFYCDVSDAWMFPQRSRRLWVMLAGTYCDLVLWALALLVWRLTLPGLWFHDLAWVVWSVCSVRLFLNLNPLIKLDGYYLLSDTLRMPNLRQRSWAAVAAWLRTLCWGAPRPPAQERGRWLVGFGILSWLYSLALIALTLYALLRWAVPRWGLLAATPVVLLALSVGRGFFQGLASGEVTLMFRTRRRRTMAWAVVLVLLLGVLTLGRMDDHASGVFKLRAVRHVSVRAPLAAYLRDVQVEEGHTVEAGQVLATLEVLDLASRLAQKQAELLEVRAKLGTLEAGTLTIPPDNVRLLTQRRIQDHEIAAARAHVTRLEAEIHYLQSMSVRQTVASPIAGQVLTPHLVEKVGQYLADGELICEIEDPTALEVEIALPEHDAPRIRPGQSVALTTRALGTGTHRACVLRMAPVVQPSAAGETPGTVTVYCRLLAPPEELRSGMSGLARINCGRESIAVVLTHRVRRHLRTEFWW